MGCWAVALLTAALVPRSAAAAEEASTAGGCPEPVRFKRWMEEYTKMCKAPATGEMGTGETCDWITCDCLEVSMQVPVQLALVPICFEDGVMSSQLTEEERRIASQMIRGSACGDRTRELGQPCGQCDRFRMERTACTDTTPQPYRIFVPASSSVRAALGGSLHLPVISLLVLASVF
eukprot:gb/GFBE01065025.1/.p1 GENE.gb/GFBE01065025.1/~~gb/GFBE01065025.1/.p1  ORF type:complete len:177 (+),score=31.48 gb/GFBE01065025.1/:1-531(+)